MPEQHIYTYFQTPELTHRIELILHLLEYSNHIIIVKGDKDIGKTSLCVELETSEQSSLIVKKFTATASTTEKDILDVILDISENDSPPTISDLQQWLSRCESKQQVPALLIDDSDLLSDKVFAFLLQQLISDQQTLLIHLCFFCEPSFLERLAELGIEENDNRSIHIIEMPVLSEKQTAQYIKHRDTEALVTEDKLFDDKTIKQIHRISHGLPGRINVLSKQYRQDPVEQERAVDLTQAETGTSLLSKYRTPLLIGISLLVVSIAMTSVLYQTESPPAKQTIKLNLPEPSKVTESETSQMISVQESEPEPPTIDELSPPVIPELAEDLTLKDDIEIATESPEMNEALPLDTVNKNISEVIENEKQEVSPPVTEVIEEESEPAVLMTEEVEIDVDSVEKKEVAVSTSDTSNVQDWLINQNDSHYVIQLIGANEKQTIDFYLRSFSGSTNEINQLMTMNKGKPWHILTYGSYPTRDAAAEAIKSLPERARKMAPWPRSVKSLKELIN